MMNKHNLINLGYLGNTYYDTPEEAEKDYYTLNYGKDKTKKSFYRLIEIVWYTDGTNTSREIM